MMVPEVVDLSDVTWLQNELTHARTALAQTERERTAATREAERLATELASARLLIDINRGIAHESYTNGFAAGQQGELELVRDAQRMTVEAQRLVIDANDNCAHLKATAIASQALAHAAIQARDDARAVLDLALGALGARLDGASELDRLHAVAMELGLTWPKETT